MNCPHKIHKNVLINCTQSFCHAKNCKCKLKELRAISSSWFYFLDLNKPRLLALELTGFAKDMSFTIRLIFMTHLVNVLSWIALSNAREKNF